MSGDNQSSMQSPRMQIHEVLECAPHSGDSGTGLVFNTNRGEVRSILHKASTLGKSVIWVCGANGGFGGPANGIYEELAEHFTSMGTVSYTHLTLPTIYCV